MNKVSVIMPAFNAGLYISESIKSVIKQTYRNWELIIIDDGSTDNTREIVFQYKQEDRRIKYFYQTNSRQGKARNNGISHSTGDFIAFLDADDLWLPGKLDRQLKELVGTDKDLTFSNSYIFSDAFDPLVATRMNICNVEYSGIDGLQKFLESNRVPILTTVCTRKAILDVGQFSEDSSIQNAEDYHLWLKLQIAGFKFIGVDEILAAYRFTPGSVSDNDRYNSLQFVAAQVDLFHKHPDLQTIIYPYLTRHIRYILTFLKKIDDETFFRSIISYAVILKSKASVIIIRLCRTLALRQIPIPIIRFLLFCKSTKVSKQTIMASLKKKIHTFITSSKGRKLSNFCFRYLCLTTLKQHLNPKKIPIIINNFNQLDNLIKLLEYLKNTGYNNVYIIDNASSYPPLLDFYKNTEIPVFVLNENIGHQAFWKKNEIYNIFKKGYYVLTDADVLPSNRCPENFMKTFLKTLYKYPDVLKVGFALQINNIPDTYPLKETVLKWEAQFWENEIFPNGYLAYIDTTFALYRPYTGSYVGTMDFFKGIRLGGDFEARHGGWYIDLQNLSDEEIYYMKTANDSSSWTLNSEKETRSSAEKYNVN